MLAKSRTPVGLAILSLLVVLAALAPISPVPTRVAEAVPAGNRVPWQGGSWYLHGVNVPWYNWACDFGCGANGGVSSSAVQAALAPGFSQLRASNVHNVRWWMFEGDAWQISRDANGLPSSVNPTVYADIDAALALAETYDLYFHFVLFSGPTHIPSAWVNDPTGRQKLATALGPLFARYRGHPRIVTWEVVNEPEFEIWAGRIAQASVQAMVRAIADAVHANSTAYVTVGSAHLDGLGIWVGQGLDYYQAHWYDYMSSGGWCARCTDYATVKARFNLDGPLVIGELYASSSTDALQRFNDFYDKGFAGAWPWSLFADRTADRLTIDLAAARTFANQHPEAGPRAGTAPPTPTPTNTAVPPTATPTATATATPLQSDATQTITFDDRAGQNQSLNGSYPSGVIDWGTGQWWHAAPWGSFPTKSISFTSGVTSRSFTFVSPRRLVSLQVFNGGNGPSTITLSCAGQATKTVTVGAKQLTSIATGWTGTCSTVTIASSNGWDTNFDNLVVDGG